MKFIASRLSEGNKIFPTEIHCEEQGITVRIPGLFKGESQYFDYQQLSSVGVEDPMIGFSTITFYAGGNFISAHGFTRAEVNQIKDLIGLGKRKTPLNERYHQSQKVKNDSRGSAGKIEDYQIKDTRSKAIQEEQPRINIASDDIDILELLIQKRKEEAIALLRGRYPNRNDSQAQSFIDALIFVSSKGIVELINNERLPLLNALGSQTENNINFNDPVFIFFKYLIVPDHRILAYAKSLYSVYAEDYDAYSSRIMERYNLGQKVIELNRIGNEDEAIKLYMEKTNSTESIAKIRIAEILANEKNSGCLGVFLIIAAIASTFIFFLNR